MISLSPPDARSASSSAFAKYAELKSQIKAAGIMDRSLSYYAVMAPFAFAGYALTLAGFLVYDSVLALLALSGAFAFFTAQLAGIMHDCGHRAVFSRAKANDLLGTLAAGVIGMSFASWRWRHNLHHSYVNVQGRDMDTSIPFLATSELDYVAMPAFQKRFVKWQAFYYYPLGSLASFSNRIGTLSFFFRHPTESRLAELALYLPALLVLFIAPFVLFPLDKAVFVFFSAHLLSGLYLSSCFAPNHKAMPMRETRDGVSFLELQVEGSRSVRGGFLTTLFMVGLNFQIEHHLFPGCPRNKLSRLTPFVRQACNETSINFTDESFVQTNLAILRNLNTVARSRPELDTSVADSRSTTQRNQLDTLGG